MVAIFYKYKKLFFSCGTTAQIGLDPLIVKVSKSPLDKHTHRVGLPWKSEHLFAYTTTIFKPSAGFKPVVPAIKPKQNYALDRLATRNIKHIFTCSH